MIILPNPTPPATRPIVAVGHKPPGATLFDMPWFAAHLGYRPPVQHVGFRADAEPEIDDTCPGCTLDPSECVCPKPGDEPREYSCCGGVGWHDGDCEYNPRWRR